MSFIINPQESSNTSMETVDESDPVVNEGINCYVNANNLFSTCKTFKLNFPKNSLDKISVRLFQNEILIDLTDLKRCITLHYCDWESLTLLLDKNFYTSKNVIDINWPENGFNNVYNHINKPQTFQLGSRQLTLEFSDLFDSEYNFWSTRRRKKMFIHRDDLTTLSKYIPDISNFISRLKKYRPLFILVNIGIAESVRWLHGDNLKSFPEFESILHFNIKNRFEQFSESIKISCSNILQTDFRPALCKKIKTDNENNVNITSLIPHCLMVNKNQIFYHYLTGYQKTRCISKRCWNPLCDTKCGPDY